MINNNNDNQIPLAGAQCPKCSEVCIYEIHDELARSATDIIQIACHSCDHVFKTAIPHDARDIDAASPSDHHQVKDDNHSTVETPESVFNDEPYWDDFTSEPRKRSWGSTLILGVSLVAVFIMGMITMQLLSLSSPDTFEAGIEKPASITDTSETTEAVSQIPQQPTSSEPQPAVLKGPDFEVSDRSYTMSTTDLGKVMNINISVMNKGDVAGVPDTMILHLLTSDGVIVMTWPMVTKTMTNDTLIAPGSTYEFSAQLVEPPESANVLEVELQ